MACVVSMASAARTGLTKLSNFEDAYEELEGLLLRLESGTLPLDQLLAEYQRGAELLKFCRAKLESVENQIKVLDQGALKTWTAD